jgi:recombination protein RecT
MAEKNGADLKSQLANRANGGKNAPATQKKQTFSAYLTQDAIKNRINSMIGGKDGQRFITAIVSAVSVNPALSECDYGTIFSSAMLGESLKLSPSPQLGQYYMVPFKDKKRGCSVATFVLGYKGYIQLAIRSGYYKKINVLALKEGELVKYDPLNEEIEVALIEDDEVRDAAPTIGYYAMFEYQNGFRKAMYWSKKKMLKHADQYSAAFSAAAFEKLIAGKIPQADLWKYSSFWYKDFDGMALKTMLRQIISKWGIMSIDLQSAFERDNSLLNEDGTFEYVDNAPETEEAPYIEAEHKEVVEEQGTQEPPADQSAQNSFFEDQAG